MPNRIFVDTVFVIAFINHYISFVAMREAGLSQALTFDRHRSNPNNVADSHVLVYNQFVESNVERF